MTQNISKCCSEKLHVLWWIILLGQYLVLELKQLNQVDGWETCNCEEIVVENSSYGQNNWRKQTDRELLTVVK